MLVKLVLGYIFEALLLQSPFILVWILVVLLTFDRGEIILVRHIDQPIQQDQNAERQRKTNPSTSVDQWHAVYVALLIANWKEEWTKFHVEWRTAGIDESVWKYLPFSAASRSRCRRNLSSPRKHSQICFHFLALGGSVCVVRSMVEWDDVDANITVGSYGLNRYLTQIIACSQNFREIESISGELEHFAKIRRNLKILDFSRIFEIHKFSWIFQSFRNFFWFFWIHAFASNYWDILSLNKANEITL